LKAFNFEKIAEGKLDEGVDIFALKRSPIPFVLEEIPDHMSLINELRPIKIEEPQQKKK